MEPAWNETDIAIVGMAGRFPGADNVGELWRNLREGVSSVRDLTDDELRAAGVDPDLLKHPNLIKRMAMPRGVERFDATFFGFSHREAEVMDPQQRLLLECAWEALEDAGYVGETYPGPVGVFAGLSTSTYLLYQIMANPAVLATLDQLYIDLGNSGDYLTTRISHKLNLTGPSFLIQSACSTGLVAVHTACQSLLSEECDMALAGAASINVGHFRGYLYQEGGIVSPDGRCRTFDARAQGSVVGSGLGLVVLKRLADAVADGDTIRAVIKGSAINNDGALKVGYTAPSVEGQARVIAEALARSGVDAADISYVEAHGTGTPMGDPIEVEALTRAFGANGRRQFCALGSVKTNVGHLATAAGITGLIKAVLALENEQIPPSLHFERPNPEINFADSPFYVNVELRTWPRHDGGPRRAGVSAFGFGGTNAHMVLQEAPPLSSSTPSARPHQLLLLAARSPGALAAATANLADHLRAHPELEIADVAYTLQRGRKAFNHRRVLICRDRGEAVALLSDPSSEGVFTGYGAASGASVVFLFPGLGDQHLQMAAGLYAAEPSFRAEVDRSCELLTRFLGTDLREVLYPEQRPAGAAAPGLDLRRLLGRGAEAADEASRRLDRTLFAHPAMFVVEHALARLWMEWGVNPRAMIGYSLGEYTAACIAGVLSLEDALRLVAERARLVEELPAGAMLVVPLSEDEVLPRLGCELSLAAVNAPQMCVVAGSESAVADLEGELAGRGVAFRRLRTAHAFHSRLMEPVAERLVESVRRLALRPPRIPYLSNVTGTWITGREATDPEYWGRHLCAPVRFAAGLDKLFQEPGRFLLEVGPGQALSTAARQHPAGGGVTAVPCLGDRGGPADQAVFMRAVGRLWLAGIEVDGERFFRHERRRRIPLPTYPFEGRRYWIEARPEAVLAAQAAAAVELPAADLEPEPPTERLSEHPRPTLRNAYVAPRDEMERVVAGIWQKLLGIDEVGVHDDFFELGGHSLLATHVTSRLRASFGVELPPRTLFENPTVGELARHVGELAEAPVTLAALPREGELRLSFAQERLWFLDQLAPGSAAYNIFYGVRLGGPLEPGAVAGALNEVVRRHEALRTRFAESQGQPVQVVSPPLPLPLPLVDLGGLPAARREPLLLALAAAAAQRPFDLRRGPLVRAALVRLAAREHALLLAFHHIVSDGWSAGVLVREVGTLYAACLAGAPSPLPELPLQYADYALWQRQRLSGERLGREIEYWRQRLSGVAPLELPADRPRPAVQTTRGSSRPLDLGEEMRSGLVALGRQHQATLFMVGLAGFVALLARHSGQRDLAVGTPVAGRTRAEIENLVGFFVNTLVLRFELAEDPTFEELLAQAREVSLGAFAHQEVPFEKVVEQLQPERSLARSPLFQVMFALQNVQVAEVGLPQLQASPLALPAATAKFELSLLLTEVGAALSGELEHNADLFDGTTAQRLGAHLEVLFAEVIARPDRRLSQLPLLAAGERHQLLAEWNDTAGGEWRERAVHRLIEEQVRRTPEAPALRWGEEVWSYEHLNGWANRLARHLRWRGVRRGERVGIAVRRSPWMVASVLGVLKAGGSYVPLDPSYPAERLSYMLADSGVRLVVSEDGLAAAGWLSGRRLLRVDGDRAAIGRRRTGNLDLEVDPREAAYVIYTSGSTGRPKGVEISHGSLASFLATMRERPGLGPEDVVAAVTALSFDIAGLELYLPLMVGAAVMLASEEESGDGWRLLRRLEESAATVLQATPVTWRMLLEAGWSGEPALRALCGGEALGEDLARELTRHGREVWNLYGPTETTVWSTVGKVEEGERTTIGRTVARTTAYAMSGPPEVVPIGVVGELWIGGVGLARGYVGQPALTAERFVPSPFGEHGGRLYRTGDMVRRLADGQLEHLGRADHQVKVRGHRIELGEIESALAEHPGVAQAVVMARAEGGGERRLVAYVVPSGPVPEWEELRGCLAERLPEYMVPSAWVALPELPLTPNRKVDRRALPAPEAAPRRESRPARGPLEEVLAGIWSEVLGIERVGAEEDFFVLGGHSLLATQVASRVRRSLGVELPLRMLFEATTVAALARRIEQARGESWEIPPPVLEAPKSGPLPLSFAQERLWFLDQLAPGSAAYNIPAAVDLSGHLEVPALAAALAEVVRRHEALRTSFQAVTGEPVQVIAGHLEPHLPVIDLRSLPDEERERAADGLTNAEARWPFDLARGPLLRAAFLKLGDERHRVLVTMHHVVSDGWSIGVLVQELGALYAAFVAGRPSPLPELAVQYADFAVWQRRRLSGALLESELAWWRGHLAGMPPALDLPADHPRPAALSGRGALLGFALDRESLDGLTALSLRHGATLFMTLLAGFAGLLQRITGEDDLAVGTPVAGRTRVELEPLIGFFVNTLMLRLDLAGDPDVAALLARVRETALAAYVHQEVPFERLVKELAPERDLSRPPLVQVLFALQNAPAGPLRVPGLALTARAVSTGTARLELACTLAETERGLEGMLETSRDLFEAPTIARLAGHFTRLLAALAADPRQRLSELPLLSPAERAQLLVEWSGEATAFPREATIHGLFARQAALTPDAVAVAATGEALTYGELKHRAGRWARRLRALGVGPDVRVGVCLDRSPLRVVATLAVLEAGGAYVPLDPAYPRERLDLLLRESRAAALLTEERWLPVLPEAAPAVLCLDSAGPWEEPAEPQPAPQVPASCLAYVIYTSGSTGEPKGVAMPHRGVARLLQETSYARFGPDEVFLQIAPYTFDASVPETWGALLHGGRLVMPPPGVLSLAELGALVQREGVTTLLLTAGLFRQMVDESLDDLAGVRQLLAGGDVVSMPHARRVLTELPELRLLSMYGPTENTTFTSSYPVTVPEDLEPSVPLGRPIANTWVHVLDRRFAPVPAGVAGELCAGGDGLARGYLERPERTAERFVPDPFGREPGGRLYRTGDLVRWRPAGQLEFLGRIDTQVKVRGFRIEPGEVEAALLAHPQVREAVVVAHPGTGGDKQLVAYWVAADGAAPPVEELRAFLGKLLPEYMLPALFVPLAALPLNANGKVDRKTLPAPAAAREALAGSAPPRNAREALLAEIWRGVLGLERVGIHDNFFQLGGDSILSIQVVARARKAGLLLTARQFFDQQTIAGLAAVAEEAGAPGAGEAPVEGEAPLTPIQRRFFAEERRQPWRFNQAVMLIPLERLAAAPLAVALARLAEHHDALRLRFPREEDGWRQLHASADAAAESAPLFEIDLTALSAAERTRALDGAAEQLQSGLDLARGPLFTAALFRLGGEAGERLLLTAHHLIVDGVSWRVLLEDLTAAYRQPELPAKTTSWKLWAERLADFARSPEVTAELPYWLGLPVSVPPLPVDIEAKDGRAATAAISVELGAVETRALLNEAPEAYRTQVNDLLLAALVRAFAAWTGENTLLVDLEGHGREEVFPGVDLTRTVGWFTTVFPVSLALPPGGGPREAILAVKEGLRAVPRRGLGYGLLRYLAGAETGERLAALPAPQVSFNYLGRFDAAVGDGGLFAFAPEVARGAEGEALPGRHLFALDLMVLDDRLRLHWTYDPGRHRPDTVERLARGFLAEVETLVAHCLSPEADGFTPSDFPLAGLDQTALDRLLGNDRGVEDLYPLAPLQEGILFHSLYTSGADLYLEQLTAGLEGPFAAAAFAAAWQRVLERHAALRTAFVVQGVERPLQLVRREVELPWTVEDWRGLPPAELAARWQDLLAADRAQGFDLARPPLMRLTLVRTGEESHRLVWSSHHLIFDGWCFALLLTEVFTLYEAAVSGGEARLPAPRPYRDYIAWLAERDESAAERFWQEVLRGFTAPTPLPFDQPAMLRGAHGSRPEDYFERKISVPAPQAAALEALAQRLQMTLNTLVQGAWALLLSHYAQAPEVTFGAVVSGRPAELPGVESMVGLFINTLPVRVEVPDGDAASGWLARLQASQFEQRQFQWTPLARIQTLAGLSAGEPLFASLLVFENYPVDASVSERLGELRIGDVELGERTNYPLTLTVVARGDLTLRLIADHRFEPATAQRLLGHLERLLEAFAADPARPPRSLPFLSPAERHQLTADWSGAVPLHPRDATIHGLFAEQAARTPGAVAVVCGDEELTYAGVAIRSRRLAGRLLALNLPPESRIAIVAERSPALIVGLLGILQAGGAYLPLDPELPIQRLAFLLADAGATVLLGERETLDSLPAGLRLDGIRVLALDGEEEGDEAPSLPEISADGLAYVLYTSGSTGAPKGVAVPHRGVIRLVVGADWADLGPGETLLQLCHLTFDVSAFEIWAPLLNGGRLALYPGRRPDLDELAAVIARHGVTTMWLTSGLFHQMVQERLDGLKPLRQLVAGGDVLSPPHVRRALAGLPGCNLIDGYGPTENSILTATHAMTAADLADGRLESTVPIGRAVRGTLAYVLGEDLQPVPAGVWGELAAGGDGVARGYLGRPGLTAAAFVPDPFAAQPGARLYRTGDIVRWRPDGVLEFLGRRDGQVKVRGIRTELGEIEAALVRQPGVREAVVLVREEERGDKRLVAYVVSAGEPGASAVELREALRRSLPEPMVPSVIMALESLPLTANGKVDRHALARIAPLAVRQTASYTAPQGLREEMLAALWAEVLGPDRVERVGAHDDFFTLGGHSLLATQVISRVREAFGVELPVRALFEAPTVWALAARIGQEGRGPQAPPLVRVPREGDLPLSFAQQRLWFLDQLAPGNPFYNMFGAVRLTGTLEIEALRQAFREIVRRHEALRTSFPQANGKPFQAIAQAADFQLPRIDLEALSGAIPEQCLRNELARLAGEESRRPFDLMRGPLLRVHLIRLGPRDHTLLVNLHHIISDGWSMGILLREITALYGAFSEGASSPLPELPIQYADFAVWQRHWLQGERLEAELEYWRQQLAGIPEALDLPYDHPRPAIESFRGSAQSFSLPAGLVRELTALTRRLGATLSMTMLAGFQSLLGRASGREDVALGVAIANRNRREVENLIGFFVNTLVVRGDLSGSPGFGRLLTRVRDTALAAYAHQDLPFERLVEELQPERDLSRNPLVQVMCGYQNFPRTAAEVRGLVISPLADVQVAARTAKFDLTLFLFEDGDRLQGLLEYNDELFEAATVRRLLDHYENLLAAAVAQPETAVALLPMLAAAERHQLAREWNDTASAYPAAASLQELFEEQARDAPDAPALLCGASVLCYAELNRRANRLAHRLRGLGVGPGSRVGLCLERSLEMVVALLGIVKAGGAYVPLDPDYPGERLAFMMADSGLQVLVGEEQAVTRLPDDLVAGTELVLLDAEPAPGSSHGLSDSNPQRMNDGGSLAYVIYTSGSTGRPKGVAVPHRAVVRLVRDTNYMSFGPGDRMGQAANINFDAATWEIWGALLNGAAVVVIPRDAVLSPGELAATLQERRITSLFLTTALFNQMSREVPGAFQGLRELLFGGEAVSPAAVRAVLAARPPRRLLHVYGPTESTTYASWHPVLAVPPAAATIPIGMPLANTSLAVLDRWQSPVPAGVAGELCIGGDGLAWGYWNRPELTAERFVPHPWESGERLYRTGDLVRNGADGAIEFLGRLDHQVKIRGFRIELGEVESRLGEHPAVLHNVVLAREDVPGDRRLVAYVVQNPAYGASVQTEQEWSELFDDIYRQEEADADPTFNIIGWNSTYTDLPLPRNEMEDWLEDTVGRIITLDPRRVLEIGCGTGMILFRIAPRCELYTATDVSSRALDYVERQLGRLGSLGIDRSRVQLLQRSAEQLDGMEAGSFDTVILNSVAQYFPSADYLAEVIARAMEVVRPGGSIFLGDLRSLPLLEAFHTSLELFQAEPEMPLSRLRQKVQTRRQQENELAIDPAFFTALQQRLPKISRVEVYPKRGRAHNELTGFRYQAVLRIGDRADAAEIPWLDWQGENLTLAALQRRLEESAPAVLGLRNVPNARVSEAVTAARLLREAEEAIDTAGDLRHRAAEAVAGAVEPQDLWDLALELPYEVELSWASPGAAGSFEAVLRRRDGDGDLAGAISDVLSSPQAGSATSPLSHYTNNPLQGRFARRIAPELRAFVKETLPEYMVPSAFVLLDALPLSPNGKVDRRRLPAPDVARPETGQALVVPRNATEARLLEIWRELLGVERIGVEDDFFELGGHSLLATQAVSRVREAFGVELPLRTFFEAPSVAAVAAEVAGLRLQGGEADAPPIIPVPRDGLLPLSFAQERLWFLHRLDTRTLAYNESAAFRLEGALDEAALRWSLDELLRRHESLRTTFPEVDGQAVQTILRPTSIEIPTADLRGLSPTVRDAEARRLALRQALRPFDLARGPLVRGLLVRLGEREHAVLFSFHHIVFDGWSMGIFARELSALYGARIAGEPSPLPPMSIQYADFASWQRQWLRGEVLERQLAWWRERLAGVAVLDLATDRPRPVLPQAPSGLRGAVVPPVLTQRLRAFSRSRGVTPFMTLLAAFQALLHRYTGQDDVAVGSPIANRERGEVEGLIGFFVNMLVLRTDLSGDPGFGELLERVRQTALGAYAHQSVPFEKLVEELRPDRDLRRTPLFQVSLQLLNVPASSLELPGLALSPFDFAARSAKFDLDLTLIEGGERLEGMLDYDADLFDAATMERLLAHLERLLAGALKSPDRRLSELPLLTRAEHGQAVVEWNDTYADLGTGSRLHELFEAQVRRTPESVAVMFEGEELLYGELNARANRLAHVLRRCEVGPGVRVGLCVERSLEMVVGLLGVLKAGGAYVPLDPSYPRDRLAFMMSDARVPVLLTQERLLAGVSENAAAARVLCLDSQRDELAGESAENLSPLGDAGELAYVIYTSGSTGRPKGAMNSHRAICNRLLWMQAADGLTGGDRVLQKTPLSFDISVWELFWPLATGARLVLARPGGQQDPDYLVRLLAQAKITTAHFVPSMLQVFLEARDVETCASLRRVICSGEALTGPLARRFFARFPAGAAPALYNLYGPTEAAVEVTAWRCEPESPLAAVPIGRPVANTQTYVLDPHLGPAPVGIPGELHLGGVQLARGYLDRPDLTAERFIPDPFAAPERAGARLYKTGDQVRRLPGGEIVYLGRLDHQVKVRGVRIELGEIELALQALPGVREAVVIVREDTPGDARLVAYLTGDAAPETLRPRLRERLPEAMVPAVFVPLPALPLLPSGKVDRKALPAPDRGPAPGYMAPRNPAEEILAEIWQEVLGRERVGVHDNFFELGGHSLLAVLLMARIEKRFGKTLSLATLFAAPTLESLAALLDRFDGQKQGCSPLVAIQPQGDRPPFFCVHPVGGNVLCYLDLARHLPPDQPFYALQSPEPGGDQPASIEEMAALYLSELRRIQPEGPYRLGGWSMGGLIAFEMARQLERAGQELDLVVLIDTPPPAAQPGPPPSDDELATWFRRDLAGLLGHEPPEDFGPAQMRSLFATFAANLQASRSFVRRPYSGNVTLILSQQTFSAYGPELLDGWRRSALGGIETSTLPGDHYSLLRPPQVALLAQELTARLAAAVKPCLS